MPQIPYEKLMDGYSKCLKHIEGLIEAGEILHASKKYQQSIPLAILALEESYKIVLFQQHLRSKQGISEQRWLRISRGDIAHRNKLTNIYAEGKEEIRNHISKEKYAQVAAFQENLYGTKVISYAMAKNTDGVGMERLAALNEVKKHCFYIDWDGSDWSSFSLSSSETEQQAISEVELTSAKFMLVGAKRWLEWPIIPQPGTKEFTLFENHPIMREDIALHRHLKSAEFQQMIEVSKSTLDRYRKLMKSKK